MTHGAPRTLREHAAAVLPGRDQRDAGRVAAILPPSPRVAVLGTASDAPPLAAAIALALRTAEGAATAVAGVWHDPAATGGHEVPAPGAGRASAGSRPWDASPAGDPPAVTPRSARPATRAARRLAAWLRGRGAVAVARGRLVWVEAPLAPGDAVAAARRLGEAVHEPVVTAIAGARPAGLDLLVREQDLVVVAAEPGSALAEAALAALGRDGQRALACAPLRRGLPRSAALAGVAAPRLDLPLATTGEAHGPA